MVRQESSSSADSLLPGTEPGAHRENGRFGGVPPELSVVLPVYNERENLEALLQRLKEVLTPIGISFELIFVDDGSADGTADWLAERAETDEETVLIELARNFGHQTAISAGLDFAQGQAVIVMDADLQDPPEMIPSLLERWREGYQVVYAIRQQRQEGPLLQWTYKLFYRLLSRVASIEIPLDSGDFCLMDRQVVDLLVAMPERNRFLRGIRSWVGMRQIGVPYERHARHAGESKYTFSRLLLLALDGFVSFSYMPLRVITLLGFLTSFLSILLAIFYTVKRIAFGLSPPGFATLVVAIFFLAGVQLVTVGVIGEYVGRIFDEVKQRPLYVTRRITGR
jgi:dolichol-phosphate mannosyltransferase